MEKKQTAVKWFNEQIVEKQNGEGDLRTWDMIFKQALEKEKQQIMDALHYFGIENAEKYYEDTFIRQIPLEKCTCTNGLSYSNCDKKCERHIQEQELEQVADFLGDKIEKLESIRTYKEDEEQEMSEADKIEERGIAIDEDRRQSDWDKE